MRVFDIVQMFMSVIPIILARNERHCGRFRNNMALPCRTCWT